MQPKRRSSRLIGIVWIVLGLALVAMLVAWGIRINGTILHPELLPPLPSPAPVTAVSTVITQYPGESVLTRAELCADVAPQYNAVTLTSPSGAILDDVRC